LPWGKSVVIVDPNWLPEEVQYIRDFVRHHYADRKQFLLFTHADYDHILGYGAFPDAEVIAGKDFVINPLKDAAVQQILDLDDLYYIQRNYPIVYPVVDIVLDAYGQSLSSDGENAVFFPAPGHVNNGLISIFTSSKICIAGDYLSNIEIPMVEYSFIEFEKTLMTCGEIIKIYDIDVLVTGHGDIVLDRESTQKRIDSDLSYIRAFLGDFDPEHQDFETCIQTKGNIKQNRIIHENNLLFFEKTMKNNPIL